MRYAVVDLSNLISRCRHVTMGDAYTKAGMALQITFRSLRKIYRDNKIDHMVFAVDSGSWRYEIYPQYKARRKLDRLAQKPIEQEENEVFFEVAKNLVNYLRDKTRCTVLEHKNIEGDDFVARWIQRHPTDEHVIISGDSDFVQLLASNVSIYDGVQDRKITLSGITNDKGQLMEFSVKPQEGKIKVGVANANFIPEKDWWKKSLFVKLIRGDSGDGIFSAYPGVRFVGSEKREGISEAWEDRFDKGYHWNNFFQQEWSKLLGVTEDGEKIVSKVKVIDEFKMNTLLIDLACQPQHVKISMDKAIEVALAKPLVNAVGIHFLRFCGENDLPALAKEATEHASYLNASYPTEAEF